MNEKERKLWEELLTYLTQCYEDKPLRNRLYIVIDEGDIYEWDRTGRADMNELTMDVVQRLSVRWSSKQNTSEQSLLDVLLEEVEDIGRNLLNVSIEDAFQTHEVSWGLSVKQVMDNMDGLFNLNTSRFVSLSYEEGEDSLLIAGDTFDLKDAQYHIMSGADLFAY